MTSCGKFYQSHAHNTPVPYKKKLSHEICEILTNVKYDTDVSRGSHQFSITLRLLIISIVVTQVMYYNLHTDASKYHLHQSWVLSTNFMSINYLVFFSNGKLFKCSSLVVLMTKSSWQDMA